MGSVRKDCNSRVFEVEITAPITIKPSEQYPDHGEFTLHFTQVGEIDNITMRSIIEDADGVGLTAFVGG
jgi:hypothetical protein